MPAHLTDELRRMKGARMARLFKHIMTNNRAFLKAVVYSPSAAAACAFVLYWLVLGKDIASSLKVTAFVFILLLFIGVVYLVMERRKRN